MSRKRKPGPKTPLPGGPLNREQSQAAEKAIDEGEDPVAALLAAARPDLSEREVRLRVREARAKSEVAKRAREWEAARAVISGEDPVRPTLFVLNRDGTVEPLDTTAPTLFLDTMNPAERRGAPAGPTIIESDETLLTVIRGMKRDGDRITKAAVAARIGCAERTIDNYLNRDGRTWRSFRADFSAHSLRV